MVKHPTTRAERLRIKQLKDEKKSKERSLKRQLKVSLEEREKQDELREFKDSMS